MIPAFLSNTQEGDHHSCCGGGYYSTVRRVVSKLTYRQRSQDVDLSSRFDKSISLLYNHEKVFCDFHHDIELSAND